MLEFDASRCITNVRQSSTDDLLDRVTAFRSDLEPQAIPIIERELRNRGIDSQAIREYATRNVNIVSEAGHALKCIDCQRPAVTQAWGWHKIWGFIPVFPRLMRWCEVHRPIK